jgi:5-methylcytosine-specific restriction protein A
MRGTFLLTWNPARVEWPDLARMARRVQRGERLRDRWSCARSKQLRRGDRLFMLRQGTEPRGIFASGWALTDWYEGPSWRRPGSYCHYLDLFYDALYYTAVLPRDALRHGALADMYWDTQSSGPRIPDPVARALEKIWASRLLTPAMRRTKESAPV